jgi:hypothetical protein
MDWQPGRGSTPEGASPETAPLVHPRATTARALFQQQVCYPHYTLIPTRPSAPTVGGAELPDPAGRVVSAPARLRGARRSFAGSAFYLWRGVVRDLAVMGMGPSPLIKRATQGRSKAPGKSWECYRRCYRSRLPAATGLLPV